MQEVQQTAAQTAIQDATNLIANLELPYLIELSKELEKHIEARQGAARVEALAAIQRIVADVGLPLADIIGFKASAAGVRAKYQDPTTGKTWTGRGSTPKWVREAIDSGRESEIAINPSLQS